MKEAERISRNKKKNWDKKNSALTFNFQKGDTLVLNHEETYV